MTEWTPAEVKAPIEFQHTLNAELLEAGELVDAQGPAGPDVAKFVVSDGVNPPKIVDGPYPESKELLAGYRMVDVESLERALGRPRRLVTCDDRLEGAGRLNGLVVIAPS